MMLKRTYQIWFRNGLRLLLQILLLTTGLQSGAQIVIRGNVYGGGNEGDVGGDATVTVWEGDLNKVFGGARMADVGGRAFVNIDGENANDFILINYVYGGNDVSGTIGSSTAPAELTKKDENHIDDSWNAFIRVSSAKQKTETVGDETVTSYVNTQPVYIGQLFGGGNGDYDYDHEKVLDEDGNETSEDNPYFDLDQPDLEKTYLEIVGGSIVYAYGGGNNATVTGSTVICVDNPSPVVSRIPVNASDGEDLITKNYRHIEKMGINPGYSYPSSDAYQIGRFFGGNNQAEMKIRPTWNLKDGKIRELFSGGNKGDMTSPEGLLLEIAETSTIQVDNLYGGCRMANVIPKNALGNIVSVSNLSVYNFPEGLSARVVIRGGHINNVYGGNDITGKVYGGSAIGIWTTVFGDVYGGGNGSYPYTDNPALKDDPTYGDFYYDPGSSSVDALNAFRPNAEQVSIRVRGTETKKTVIHGSLYLGGNCATLMTDIEKPRVELKIGSYVIADNVFLGNNGENMVKINDEDTPNYVHEGVLKTYTKSLAEINSTRYAGNQTKFNSMVLKDTEGNVFADYMKGAAMSLMPRVVFDGFDITDKDTYIDYTTFIGSFYCGGNVGSMIKEGLESIEFDHKVVIFDKVVGGCNNAYVEKTDYNAAYDGGVLGTPDNDGNKLELNLSGLKIQPMRWVVERDNDYNIIYRKDDGTVGDKTNGHVKYLLDDDDNPQLEWNTIYASTGKETLPVLTGTGTSSEEDLDRRLTGGNIYGGCYTSGHVNGNVTVNLNATIIDRHIVFDAVEEDSKGEAIYYSNSTYKITERHSGVILGMQGMEVLGHALNVFGGGKGKGTEIWGSTTINLNAGYTFQIFGGSEEGVIGKSREDSGEEPQATDYEFNGKHYAYNDDYSCIVNLCGTRKGVTKQQDTSSQMAECEFIYGGGFEGPIAGNTQINLGNGRIFNSFAGSCNADILGHTETYVGRSGVEAGADVVGFPYVRDYVYGGNDLGGKILGNADFSNRVVSSGQVSDNNMLKASAYVEYTQGRAIGLFGGCYGTYDYSSDKFSAVVAKPGFSKPYMGNAFVNFRPTDTAALRIDETNVVEEIYGAGQGNPMNLEEENPVRDMDMDKLQESSYVLIDIPQEMENFKDLEVFGAGAWSGLGMKKTKDQTTAEGFNLNTVSSVIDLARGQIYAAYGGSFKEGVTRRTVVNVPANSTIYLKRIFGGAYGEKNTVPCDVYESNVNYLSQNAVAEGDQTVEADWQPNISTGKPEFRSGAVFGGNNNCRRTLYSKVNIDAKVVQDQSTGYTTRIFGAGYGKDTWAQYTEVHLESHANVYEVYGGGYGGMVLNKESVNAWNSVYKTLGSGYTDEGLNGHLVQTNPLGEKTNTNVYINQGAWVSGYCYGGGQGADATVSGTTYIGLHGGEVSKDIYGGGWGGGVFDKFGVGKAAFTATTNAYIEGGTLRKVFGGGFEGSVGYHDTSKTETATDIPGVANVVIGIRKDQASLPAGYGFYKGVPAIKWNAYGAGEGGAVYGTAKLTINNGYIGYYYDESIVDDATTLDFDERYQEKLDDETWPVVAERTGRLKDYGNAFGAGYDDKSSSDYTDVKMWGGVVRGSLYGGGEISTVGRGKTKNLTGTDRGLEAIYLAGGTHVEMYNGHVIRNVFGGGKGYNDLGYGGTHELYTDGYVFGQTKTYIYGGEVGTAEGVAEEAGGYGNVFGGGDVGFVYSKGYFSEGTAAKEGTTSPNHIYYKDAAGNLTEDCMVVVSPMLQVRPGKSVTYGGVDYGPYDYVPTDYLNTLMSKEDDAKGAKKWKDLFCGDGTPETDPDDVAERGVIIHNAVFGGGNVSSNTERTYANATTVFGNTTATLYDVYHRDFITVGTEHTGGLYGGGNLSMVDGYRELNITNYGTDYYGLDQQISLKAYQDSLTNRERAYFKLEYLCMQDVTIDDQDYKKDDRISEDEYNALPEAYKSATYWVQYGFCSIYAGRLLNTIQRADLCGVYGSRMVLQGARDRVADVGDKTPYTINRVGELSLNKKRSVAGDTDTDKKEHGNYFGIYSVVNYLGNLTSDVHFDDTYYKYENHKSVKVEGETYYHWKTSHLNKRDRNNGTCLNHVALASGVFLELTTENSTKTKKDYGFITGIVELDLINVKKDIEGGGYVYARNEHRIPNYYEAKQNVILSDYNMKKMDGSVELRDEACTYKRYRYTADAGDWPGTAEKLGGDDGRAAYGLVEYETSGNFIHRSKRIVDDCYPNNGVYNDGYKASPAHYWYIKGEVYIYDQEVSAYAGSASSYSKEVKIPLTITAASNGQLKLLNVQPSLYAYYADENKTTRIGKDGVKVNNDSEVYYLNDVITWWDWNQLPSNEQKYFVKETYVNVDTCKVDGTEYDTGKYALLPTELSSFAGSHTVLDKYGNTVTDITSLFHTSNNISHETGYVLTFDMDSPLDWDDWYSPVNGTSLTDKIKKEVYKGLSDTQKADYREGPTFTLNGASGLYGQRDYEMGEIIPSEVYTDYVNTVGSMDPKPTGQAEVERAYVALQTIGNVQEGNGISQTDYNALSDKSNYAEAKVCTSTIRLGEEEYILQGELVSASETNLDALAAKYKAYNDKQTNTDEISLANARIYIEEHLSDAYICKTAGKYGGQYFESGINYSALKAYCALTDDRTKFKYNYDAFDVLVDSSYPGEGHTNVYDAANSTPLYSAVKPVEYTAANLGTSTLTYYYENESESTATPKTVESASSISREEFEKIKNEQRHYTRIIVPKGSDKYTAYISNESFVDAGVPIAKGEDVTEKYSSLSTSAREKLTPVEIQKQSSSTQTKYYCYEAYGNVTAGTLIDASDFSSLKNYQAGFTIQGKEPTETTTLYVSRESNAKDVTSEKIITVVYQYTYYEADEEDNGVSSVNELHVVNIHLKLESGVPEIGTLNPPNVVLPGSKVGLKAPSVNPGLYEIITNEWEMYTNEEDALNHRNGKPFTNNGTPVYWYQNNKMWVAFYSKTYLGKTYSNPVPVTVANYHDLHDVMADTDHHMYIDHTGVERDPKIYINQDNHTEENQLDLLQSLFTLSTGAAVAGHEPLSTQVGDCKNLEFILQSDLSPAGTWKSLGDDSHCFEGTLHGDGYTIGGLDNSLFARLCGEVYNLGVTGTFTTSGIAVYGTGYLENCWVKKTEGTVDTGTKALFDNPTNTAKRTIHLVNCYYPEENGYTAQAGATEKPLKSFYNGEVAYDLNGFYLFKRYCDSKLLTTNGYKYLKEEDGALKLKDGYYEEQNGPWLLKDNDDQYVGCYVESRYADGDFIYADGTIPDANDVRMRTETVAGKLTNYFSPIWPDDYLFFGQALNYGHVNDLTHQSQPSIINKNSGRLVTTKASNRVYRAPAYYGNSVMSVAHFNPYAVFANTKKGDNTVKAHEGLTAIDFTGYNDAAYAYGLSGGKFYPPLLDDDGLIGFRSYGLTKNMLVYTVRTNTAMQKTDNVVSAYLPDEAYEEKNSYYRTVDAVDLLYSNNVNGHWVQRQSDNSFLAKNDHYLLDDNDFNAPISYKFDTGKRMWYQRMPDNYVTMTAGKTKGWEGVSLPFTVEIVTTPDKGEITHFYNYQDNLMGHEYWLREFSGIKADASNATELAANFTYLAQGTKTKTYTNTFLWDYYYSKNEFNDKNDDDYQMNYYKGDGNHVVNTYSNYPMSQAGTPYLVGFPGVTYYEFDLSGSFKPTTTALSNPAQLEAQSIVFASEEKATILVSDTELAGGRVSQGNYVFCPTYATQQISDAQVTAGCFLLNDDGDKYQKLTAATTARPFRPYFVTGPSSARSTDDTIESIIFSNETTQMSTSLRPDGMVEDLMVKGGKRKIVVESQLRYTTDVRIVTPAGITITTFSIQPTEYIETRIESPGVYIVEGENGKYVKKVIVR